MSVSARGYPASLTLHITHRLAYGHDWLLWCRLNHRTESYPAEWCSVSLYVGSSCIMWSVKCGRHIDINVIRDKIMLRSPDDAKITAMCCVQDCTFFQQMGSVIRWVMSNSTRNSLKMCCIYRNKNILIYTSRSNDRLSSVFPYTLGKQHRIPFLDREV